MQLVWGEIVNIADSFPVAVVRVPVGAAGHIAHLKGVKHVARVCVDILSTYPDNTYATLSGTSMATPHVSATVALIQAARLAKGLPPLPPGTFNDSSTSTIRGLLHVTAEDLGPTGYDDLYGYRVVRVDKALEKV